MASTTREQPAQRSAERTTLPFLWEMATTTSQSGLLTPLAQPIPGPEAAQQLHRDLSSLAPEVRLRPYQVADDHYVVIFGQSDYPPCIPIDSEIYATAVMRDRTTHRYGPRVVTCKVRDLIEYGDKYSLPGVTFDEFIVACSRDESIAPSIFKHVELVTLCVQRCQEFTGPHVWERTDAFDRLEILNMIFRDDDSLAVAHCDLFAMRPADVTTTSQHQDMFDLILDDLRTQSGVTVLVDGPTLWDRVSRKRALSYLEEWGHSFEFSFASACIKAARSELRDYSDEEITLRDVRRAWRRAKRRQKQLLTEKKKLRSQRESSKRRTCKQHERRARKERAIFEQLGDLVTQAAEDKSGPKSFTQILSDVVQYFIEHLQTAFKDQKWTRTLAGISLGLMGLKYAKSPAARAAVFGAAYVAQFGTEHLRSALDFVSKRSGIIFDCDDFGSQLWDRVDSFVSGVSKWSEVRKAPLVRNFATLLHSLVALPLLRFFGIHSTMTKVADAAEMFMDFSYKDAHPAVALCVAIFEFVKSIL